MKNLILFALVLLGLKCLGQHQALLGYKNNSVSEVKNFLTDSLTVETPKAYQIRNFLFLKTGESNLDKLFSRIKIGSVDTTLGAGTYQNSCWNVSSGKVEVYPGKNRHCPLGIAYYYPQSGNRIPLWIVDCGNVIHFLSLSKDDEPFIPGPKKAQVVLVDTVHLKVYVYDSVPTPECDTCCPINYVTNITYYGDGERYQPYQSGFYSGWLGYQWGWYGSGQSFRDDHYCRIETNYTTINNSWSYDNSQIILPTPKPEPGGPAVPPGHDDPGGLVTPPGSGGPLIQPGHDDPGGGHITPPGDGVRKVPPPHVDDPKTGKVVTNEGHDDKKANSSSKANRSRKEEILPTVKSRVAKKFRRKEISSNPKGRELKLTLRSRPKGRGQTNQKLFLLQMTSNGQKEKMFYLLAIEGKVLLAEEWTYLVLLLMVPPPIIGVDLQQHKVAPLIQEVDHPLVETELKQVPAPLEEHIVNFNRVNKRINAFCLPTFLSLECFIY
jgi:hypothetical protein